MMKYLALASGVAATASFGPKHCVSVYKSEQTGTCVIQTNCNGVNLDEVEFAFTCQLPNMLQKHSFGKGGFDAVEEYDTSVKCNECGIPADVTMSLEKQQAASTSFASSMAMVNNATDDSTNATDNSTVTVAKVSYGPSGCISTWLKADTEKNVDGENGTCQVSTNCTNVTNDVFGEYPMGLVCVDKDKMPTRHLFGSNSFDKTEDFDTLIRCTTCLGLDKVSESITLEATVKSLAKEVYEIKDEVYKLEKKADGSLAAPKAEEAKTEEAAPAAEEAPAAELSQSSRTNLRGASNSESEENNEESSEEESESED